MVDLKTAKAWVESRLSHNRFAHSLRVAEVAGHLAKLWCAPWQKAVLAGILHDAARELTWDELCRLITTHGIDVTEHEMQVDALLHAPVGAFLVRTELGLDDAEICAAIRYHTTGRPRMSSLEKIIFLADYIEPGRDFPGVDKVRILAETNLNEALRRALDQTIEFLAQQGRSAHPFTVEARKALPVPGERGAPEEA